MVIQFASGHLANNRIGQTGECLFVNGFLSGSGNILEGGSFATIVLSYQSVAENFHDNHILNAGGLSLDASLGLFPPRNFDFTNNYWGTADPGQIAEWIEDRNDNSSSWMFIDYQPFHTDPVGTKPKSMGSFKALFGGN